MTRVLGDHVLYRGDCLEVMAGLPGGSVDLVLTDPPYGTTACKWDSVIPFDLMWAQLKRIIKPNGAIVLTASQPFTSALIMSNIGQFKYCWVWCKNKGSNFATVKYMPLKQHEDIAVFYSRAPVYNPIRVPRSESSLKRDRAGTTRIMGVAAKSEQAHTGITRKSSAHNSDGLKSPNTVLGFKLDTTINKGWGHPTQKPVALMEYMIKTYTHPGETVLDFTMGSGTTGVGCVNTGRKFIGIELDSRHLAPERWTKYFDIATGRILEALIAAGAL